MARSAPTAESPARSCIPPAGLRAEGSARQLLLEEGQDPFDALLLSVQGQRRVLDPGELDGDGVVAELGAEGVEAPPDREVVLVAQPEDLAARADLLLHGVQ